MISCADVEEFIPFGRSYLENHPGDVGLPVSQPEKPKISQDRESWILRTSKDGLTEEELYIRGSTAVWSRGDGNGENNRTVIKSFSCESNIKQAIFASFYTYPDLPSFIGEQPHEDPTGDELESVCILENDCLNVFSKDGDDFFVKLPFPVAHMWVIRYGIMLERHVSPNDDTSNLPTIYSLLHPLDEISPITLELSSMMQNLTKIDIHNKVVFASSDPSICVMHSKVTNTISTWRIQRVKHEENMIAMATKQNPSSLNASIGHSNLDSNPHSPLIFSPSQSPFSQGSYLNSRSSHLQVSGTPNRSPGTFGSQTPSQSRSNPSLFGCDHLRLGLSPSPAKTPRASTSFSVMEESTVEPSPLIPDLSLKFLWKENSIPEPSKVFLTEDSVGQKFMCLFLSQSASLRCIKYEMMNDTSRILFGVVASLPAKDAAPLSKLHMMVVVDTASSVTLYTGITQICRLHIAGLPSLNSTLFRDFSSLNISSRLQSPSNTPLRRASLATSSRPTSALDVKFEVGLSPVSTEKSINENPYIEDHSLPLSFSVQSLKDGLDLKVTLVHASGNLYRITLPVVSSCSLVEMCLSALKYILPREVALHVICKWYLKRNSPGNTDFSPQGEWQAFSMTLLSLIGYDIDKLSPACPLDASGSLSPMVSSKKFRGADSGSDSDWEYLLSSSYHQAAGGAISEALGLQPLGIIQTINEPSSEVMFNTSAVLFNHFYSILLSLHLVYEEMKLISLKWEFCSYLAPTLSQLASDLNLKYYLHHYWRDFPTVCPLQGPTAQIIEDQRKKLVLPKNFLEKPPHIMNHLQKIMREDEMVPFPYIPGVCTSTKCIVLLYCVAATDCPIDNIPINKFLSRISPTGQKSCTFEDTLLLLNCRGPRDPKIHEKIVMLTDKLKFTSDDIQQLAPGVSLMLMNSEHMCRTAPPQNWPASSYQLIQRSDLVAQRNQEENYRKNLIQSNTFTVRARLFDNDNFNSGSAEIFSEFSDGMDGLDWELLRLRWPEDQRVSEVRKMINSSKPVSINIVQRPEVSDHDFVEEQERHLYALCVRTMSLPMGRSMFTLCTQTPIVTEALTIPPLDLTGRAPPRGTTIDFTNIEVAPNMNMWPLFHNGVGAGLKISPNCNSDHKLNSSWIVYNKPKGNGDISTGHAGFLMALGLNGHLKSLAVVSLHDYLTRGTDMTTVGLLIGVAASRRGTMDMQITKLLSCYLECLLPPTSSELDVAHPIQVAAIMGVGLLYQDTAHRHMAEVLLQEIGRPPGPEMENCTDRESYSLAAGLSLGLVMFGRGGETVGLTDLNIDGELYHYIDGGHRKPIPPFMKERYRSPSYQIREGDRVNVDVTAPGATLALGMIYFDTNNTAVADWMVAPNTPFLLDQVKPDFLLLRTISHGLIMWNKVIPSSRWIESHVSPTILTHVHRGGNQSTPGIDYESMHQAYYNILAGACMVLGLKFAGSANNEAFNVLWKYTRMFVNFTTRSVAELAGKSTIETCLNIILLSLSMVMAGTGDLQILRIIRFLRSRIGPTNSTVGYGSHLAIHMALGFLFLGGGRFSLGTSNMSIAALLIACFPKFPTHSNDNRYHLQALRHLYVLAAEPRLVIPVDVDTKKLHQAKVSVWFKNTSNYRSQSYTVTAPTMLPELSKLSKVIIEGDLANDRYWPIRFSHDENSSWDLLKALLCGEVGVPVKLKDGRYPYNETPADKLMKIYHLITKDKSANWAINTSFLEEIFGGCSSLVRALVGEHKPGKIPPNTHETALLQSLSTIIYEYLTVGKPEVITNWIIALQGIRKISALNQRSSFLAWQIKLISISAHFLYKLGSSIPPDSFLGVTEVDSPKKGCDSIMHHSGSHNTSIHLGEDTNMMDTSTNDVNIGSIPGVPEPLVSPEQALSISKQLKNMIDSWHEDVKEELIAYVKGENRQYSVKCALTLVFEDFPIVFGNKTFQNQDTFEIINTLQSLGLPRKCLASMAKLILFS